MLLFIEIEDLDQKEYNLTRKYEMMFILEVGEESKIKDEIKEILKPFNPNIFKEEDFGLRTLAYPIKKREKGFYYLLNLELEANALAEINSEVRLNENILKYMCTHYKEPKPAPAPRRQKEDDRRPSENQAQNSESNSEKKAEAKESASTEE